MPFFFSKIENWKGKEKNRGDTTHIYMEMSL
jgi:hypothetical protein